MKALIFGGAGFVGLNVAEALLAASVDVTLFDLAAPPGEAARVFAELPGRLEWIEGDVTETAAVRVALKTGIDFVVHGAALTSDAAREAREPAKVLAVNLTSLVAVLEAVRDAGVRRTVILSSAGAYGEAGQRFKLLVEDETPEDPRGLYAVSKFAGERTATRLGDLWGLDVRCVRLSGVFGPWERGTGARDTLSPHHQLMRLADLGGEAVLPRPGVRDWLYAPDAGAAVARLLQAPSLRHKLYNVSTGQTWTLELWGHELAALLPGFACRVADPGETPNIDLHGASDRAPLGVARMNEDLGPARRSGCARSAQEYARWWAAHAEGLHAPSASARVRS